MSVCPEPAVVIIIQRWKTTETMNESENMIMLSPCIKLSISM